MVSEALNINSVTQACLTETERNFAAALRKIAEPFADWSNATFMYYPAAGKSFETIGEPCFCCRFEDVPGRRFSARKHFLREIELDGDSLGNVVLCCAENASSAEKTLARIVKLATQDLSRIEDESALLAELSASWESLQAVYDLNADFSSFQDPKSLLKKITERTTAIHSRMQSVLWLEKADKLEPAVANCRAELVSRPKHLGVTGEAFNKKRSLIFNDSSRLLIDAETEPEFGSVKRLALIPLTTRLSTYGILAVWLETEDFAFDSRTMRLLDTLALQAAMVAENDRLHRESIRNAKLNQEIEIGSKIQQTLLSGTPPAKMRGLSIAAASISSQKIDGDFYDFIEHGADCFDLIIGDVMGKGIPAALVGAATKNGFLRSISYLQTSEKDLRPSTEKIVTAVNRRVTPKLMQFESFVTACYARFDLEKKEVTFVDCGHTKTIHFHARERRITLLEGDNLPLGFSEREIYEEHRARLENEDILFFYSDGVTETKNPQDELFGDIRLQDFIRENAALEPEQLIDSLLAALTEFSTVNKFNDDLTCVAVKIGQPLTP